MMSCGSEGFAPWPMIPKDFTAWRKKLNGFAAQYRGKIQIYEMLNETNIWGGRIKNPDPSKYYEMTPEVNALRHPWTLRSGQSGRSGCESCRPRKLPHGYCVDILHARERRSKRTRRHHGTSVPSAPRTPRLRTGTSDASESRRQVRTELPGHRDRSRRTLVRPLPRQQPDPRFRTSARRLQHPHDADRIRKRTPAVLSLHLHHGF